jgi:hypothetical protein
VTGLVGSGLTSSTYLSTKQEEKSQSLKITKLQQTRQNSQRTYCPLSTSTLVGKWEKEVTPIKKKELRTIKIKIYPTKKQKKLIDELFDITRYVYNKANALVKSKQFSWRNHIGIRDYIVTIKSKKAITTPRKDFELKASDSTRQCAVYNLCYAYKSATENLKAGNIRAFDISYKKKNAPRQCLELGSRDLNIENKKFKIYPARWGKDSCFRMSKKNQKKYGEYEIINNCDILRQKGIYYIALVLPQKIQENKTFKRTCGIDLGIRTLASSYGTNGIIEYDANMKLLESFNKKFDCIKNLKHLYFVNKKRIRKKALNKIERKKIDLSCIFKIFILQFSEFYVLLLNSYETCIKIW